MELGKSETDWGVPGIEGVQNGVSSDVYEGEIQEKNEKRKGTSKKKPREEKKGKMMRDSLDLGVSGLSHFEGDFLKV